MSDLIRFNYIFKKMITIHPKVYYDGISLWRLVDAKNVSGIESFDGEMVLQEFKGFNGFREEIPMNQGGYEINPYQHWG